ncbi:WD40 repeat domain-containing protein [Chamaesiphon sp. GL140_3_metabinner_50]|uniref:WD40 repeat domain-containing protein n=1 Tax=Chamaesiphon sp. GL140_3_metabinner_50 TaxID=2970812 RepID=UPI0025D7C6BD|nr:WD40 repeat domain-containing protein [Chamaesiphon sp. GL140_3_metabinner_50]
MTEIQPSNTDAILGGQNRLTTDTVVLGGIEGIEQRLTSQDEEIQISALRATLKYDNRGLELLIDVWKNDSHQLKWQAFSLLRDRQEQSAKRALSEFNPWLNMSCIHTWEQDSIARSIAIAPDGHTLFSGNEQQINVLDMQTKQQKSMSFPYHETGTLIVTPDGKSLISRGGYIKLISSDVHNYVFANEVNEALIRNSPGIETMYFDSDRGIISWNIRTGEYIMLLEEYSYPASSLVISPCERFLIYSGWYSIVKVRNIKTGKPAKNLSQSKNFTHTLAISNDGKIIIGGGKDAQVKIWDFKTRELSMIFKHKDTVRSVAISPDNLTVVSGSTDETVKVWDLQARKIKFTLKGHKCWVYGVVISPDGNYIFSCSSDKTIRVWDLHTGKCVNILTGHTELIHCLVVSPDGKTLVSSSRDRTIRVWQRQF